jgi:hypothetical protein
MVSDVHARCPKNNVWALMQEPYIKGETDWMVRGHKAFARVYTHHPPSKRSRYVASQPAVPWHVNRSFDQLTSMLIPAKSRQLSWITSDKTIWPGHIKRMALLKAIQKDGSLGIDLFGVGISYIEDKWNGLADYKYSLAIENHSGLDYWTEKLADCFLSWTIPIYYGCTNLEEYFPADSFIQIDISQPEKCVEEIKRILADDDWNTRYEALEQARNLYLYKYQFIPFVVGLIRSELSPTQELVRKNIKIPAYKDPWLQRLQHKLRSMLIS